MATARQIKAAVRKQLADQIERRSAAAITVSETLADVRAAEERLTAARAAAGAAVAAAVEVMPLEDLAEITGRDLRDLRALRTRAARAASEDLPTDAEPVDNPAPLRDDLESLPA